ncbi:MAG: galactose mutarotase [Rikenellaceae bacterium]|nr:galactose mutarotase [Rikenellaceae bacterium]
MDIEQNVWGFTPEGEAVIIYTMTNSIGAYVKLTNIGAAIVGIGVPDKDGKIDDIVLGFRDYNDYFGDSAYLGKTVGRYANRIANGRFTLNGEEYKLARNNGPNHLHGGPNGLAEKLWQSRTEVNRVIFTYITPDGEEKYPGNIGIEVVYDWNDECELEITYYAKTDKPTILNLTNHVYFNLKGEGNGDIHSHILQLNAGYYLPTDSTSIPLGEPESVIGTPMDFTSDKEIGRDINEKFEQLIIARGYDHTWILDNWQKGKLLDAGYLYEPTNGRIIYIQTTQPGLQVYTGNYLDGCGKNKKGEEHISRGGIALECQLFPDSPNKPDYPSAVLNPEDDYEQHIIYRFGIK